MKTTHSPSLWQASRSNPRHNFSNCMQNDVTLVSFCLTTFHKRNNCILLHCCCRLMIPTCLLFNECWLIHGLVVKLSKLIRYGNATEVCQRNSRALRFVYLNQRLGAEICSTCRQQSPISGFTPTLSPTIQLPWITMHSTYFCNSDFCHQFLQYFILIFLM